MNLITKNGTDESPKAVRYSASQRIMGARRENAPPVVIAISAKLLTRKRNNKKNEGRTRRRRREKQNNYSFGLVGARSFLKYPCTGEVRRGTGERTRGRGTETGKVKEPASDGGEGTNGKGWRPFRRGS